MKRIISIGAIAAKSTSWRVRTVPRLRVLLIAEAANPNWTSAPLIGWELSRALARRMDVHLVTQIRNRAAIAARGLMEDRDFTVIDNEDHVLRLDAIAQRFSGKAGRAWTAGAAFGSIAYYSFEYRAWARFAGRLAAREFDLVHRINPVSPTSQSIMASRLAHLGIPFVLGPLNGGIPWPRQFRDRQYAEREWLSHVRGLYKLMPAFHSTRRNSAAIIVGSQFTRRDMPAWAQNKCVYIPENGINPDRFTTPRIPSARSPLEAIFVGRLVPYKGADILIKAASPLLRAGKLRLNIVGDGPQRDELAALVRQLELESAVRFHGWIKHENVQDLLKACDFFAFPSIREFGGGVVLEAMALAVPPIVADYGGPSELVDSGSGLRIPFSDEASLIAGFRSAMARVVASPEMLVPLGAAARARVLDKFTWDAKAAQIERVYRAALSGERNLGHLGLVNEGRAAAE